MMNPPQRGSLEDELHRLRIKMWVKEVELLNARSNRDRFASFSSMGWLASIGSLGAGTVIAVLCGDESRRRGEEVSRLEHERTLLAVALANAERKRRESPLDP